MFYNLCDSDYKTSILLHFNHQPLAAESWPFHLRWICSYSLTVSFPLFFFISLSLSICFRYEHSVPRETGHVSDCDALGTRGYLEDSIHTFFLFFFLQIFLFFINKRKKEKIQHVFRHIALPIWPFLIPDETRWHTQPFKILYSFFCPFRTSVRDILYTVAFQDENCSYIIHRAYNI